MFILKVAHLRCSCAPRRVNAVVLLVLVRVLHWARRELEGAKGADESHELSAATEGEDAVRVGCG